MVRLDVDRGADEARPHLFRLWMDEPEGCDPLLNALTPQKEGHS